MVKEKIRSKLIDFIIPILISIGSYIWIFGFDRLNPANITWLSHTGWKDAWGAYLGWESYKQSAWANPIGKNLNYGLGLGNSIVYTDSIPLVAIPLKIFAKFLPDPFQFFGIWILFCLVMQALVAWKIISYFTKNRLYLSASTILFVFSPILLNRTNTHMSQVAHFLILSSLLLNIRQVKYHFNIAWPVLLCASALVHPYFLVINFTLFTANILDNLKNKRINLINSLKIFFTNFLLMLLTTWQSGYFTSISGAANPFPNTLFKMDLLQPFNANGWSFLLAKIIPTPIGNIEGFNYLGLGTIILLCIFIFTLRSSLKYFNQSAVFSRFFFFTSLFIFFLYSLTYKVTLGGRTILEFNISQFWIDLFSSFRASGRFFSPVYYFLFISLIIWIFRNFQIKFACLILLLASFLQVFDSSFYWNKISEITEKQNLGISQKYQGKLWLELAQTHTRVLILPPKIITHSWCDWPSIGYLAIKYKLSTNCIYFARVSKTSVIQNYDQVSEMLATNQIPTDVVIILSPEQKNSVFVHPELKPLFYKNDFIYFHNNTP